MISIFQKPVYKRDYIVLIRHLGVTPLHNDIYYEIYYPKNANFYYPDYITQPTVYMKDEFIEYINILETDKFTNIFSKNDKICIDNEVYTIEEVIYGIDKCIYRLNEYEIIDDEESKEEAMKEYENMINNLKEYKEDKKEKVKQIVDNLEFTMNDKLNKKWWQIWK